MFIHRATRALACATSLVVAIGLIGGTAAHAAADPVDSDSSTTAGRWHTAEERAQSGQERPAPSDPSSQSRLFSTAVAAPANDLLANATKVTSLPYQVSGQPYAGATLEAGEPATCRTTDPDWTEYFTHGERSTWYSYTSPVAQTLTFSGGVDGRGSMVIAYASASMSALTRISCTETGYRDVNHLQAKAGATYLFQVTDYLDGAVAANTASLRIEASAPISNLSPETATTVSVPSTVTGSTTKIDNNWYEPYVMQCDRGFVTMLGTRWYKYVATGTTGVRVDLRGSYYNADAAVWASDGSKPTTEIACPAQIEGDPSGPGPYDKSKAFVDFAVEPGKTYFIQVGGWGFAIGDYELKLTTYQLPLMTLTPTPKITGTAQVGSTLTANPGTWDEGTTLTYQWMRSGGAYISGATQPTYTVGAADVGTQLTVAVTGTKPGYSGARKTSAPTAVVTKGVLTSATPTISGTPTVGTAVTAVPGAWGPAPVTYTYQWLRSGSPISGATGASYTPVAADAGTALSVTVTGTKSGYTTKSATSATKTVAKGTLTGATPTISGTTKVGYTLTAKAGTWAPAPVTLSYQWLRNGVAISGATASTYKLTSTDKGKRITVRVTGIKAGYTTLAKTSAATALIG
ncbi:MULTISPECIES: hypothetical protein [Microbacterium]|uniref:hypothetical protein n=1 Tax=Microbacterium TaxID=33882 RepID=UPI002784E5E3|nr:MULTISPECIES: hypothetical protein [Microbacterium]MDQ1083948.1 hypothetical protein [Microbacterium sp. SORGH_AS_0344]MDQ1170773.1 hypothetical protein [Microbacterium proteolyticum]